MILSFDEIRPVKAVSDYQTKKKPKNFEIAKQIFFKL